MGWDTDDHEIIWFNPIIEDLTIIVVDWDFKGVNHQQWEQTWDEWGSWPSHHHNLGVIQLSTMAHIGINATLRDILRDIIYDTLMKKYFTSSGPHRDIILII